MERLLEQLYDDLTEAARSTNRIYKAAKLPQDYFTHSWKVRKVRKVRKGHKGCEDIPPLLQAHLRLSLEGLLKLWIPKWKSEGRLKSGGEVVELTDQESRLLGLSEAKEVDIYELFRLMMGLFDIK